MQNVYSNHQIIRYIEVCKKFCKMQGNAKVLAQKIRVFLCNVLNINLLWFNPICTNNALPSPVLPISAPKIHVFVHLVAHNLYECEKWLFPHYRHFCPKINLFFDYKSAFPIFCPQSWCKTKCKADAKRIHERIGDKNRQKNVKIFTKHTS